MRAPAAARLAAVLLLCAGCATPPLDSARTLYYTGRADLAEERLENLPGRDKDTVLYLMERGMIRQSLGQYEASTRDWLRAVRIGKELETHSASKAASSLAVNDRVLSFRGYPFERILLRAFLAKNYLARSLWDDAAVEVRNIVRDTAAFDGYPADAYSRYLAGVCLQLINDDDNAALEFRAASALLPGLAVDEHSGWLAPADAPAPPPHPAAQLICFVGLSRAFPSAVRSPAGFTGVQPTIEVYAGSTLLGRGYMLANTADLAARSAEHLAARRFAKQATRIVIKDALAHAVSQKNDALGEIMRVLLFAMETPDDRRWETLPLWLGAARVPCPPDLESFRVVVRSPSGVPLADMDVRAPLTRRRNTFVSFCRDTDPGR